jgi:hypothetical protein
MGFVTLSVMVVTKTQEPVSHLSRLGYNRAQAAYLLGISLPTLDRLTARRLLRPSRATRRPIYSREELERFLRETTGHLEKS